MRVMLDGCEPRRRSGLTGMVAAGALAAVLLGAPGAGAAPNAATLYRQSMATTQAWSVHYTSSGTVSKVSDTQSGDAGPASGTQQVLIQTGATSDQASLIVIGQITYAKANAAGLKDLMGLSTTQAATDANQWILFSTANAAFSQIVAGIRSHDVAEEIALKGPFTLGASRQPRRLRGRRHPGHPRGAGRQAGKGPSCTYGHRVARFPSKRTPWGHRDSRTEKITSSSPNGASRYDRRHPTPPSPWGR